MKFRNALLAALLVPALVVTGGTSVSLAAPDLANNAAPLAAGSLAGRKVFVDPGHNGSNDDSINRQVTTGRGGTKPCQTTGTTGVNGLAEHTFNYAVAYQLYQLLTAAGAQVMLSRNDDSSVGSCVDARAAAANEFGADATVSIHADGSAPANRGFHVNLSAPPLNDVQQNAAPLLASSLRDALVAGGLTPATYIGADGIFGRADLTGLNLSETPSVLVEAGNLQNPDEAAFLASTAGQQQLAQSIAAGVAAFLATA